MPRQCVCGGGGVRGGARRRLLLHPGPPRSPPHTRPQFGRNVYSRYDYEGVESEKADAMIKHLESVIAAAKKGARRGRVARSHAASRVAPGEPAPLP